jgi:hypothetical protein
MSINMIMIITALVVSSFWAGIFGIMLIVQANREDLVAEELRWYVSRLLGPQGDFSKPGRHRLRS